MNKTEHINSCIQYRNEIILHMKGIASLPAIGLRYRKNYTHSPHIIHTLFYVTVSMATCIYFHYHSTSDSIRAINFWGLTYTLMP